MMPHSRASSLLPVAHRAFEDRRGGVVGLGVGVDFQYQPRKIRGARNDSVIS